MQKETARLYCSFGYMASWYAMTCGGTCPHLLYIRYLSLYFSFNCIRYISVHACKIIAHGAKPGDVIIKLCCCMIHPGSKVHGANMGPTWGRQVPCGPYVGHVNLAIWAVHQTSQGESVAAGLTADPLYLVHLNAIRTHPWQQIKHYDHALAEYIPQYTDRRIYYAVVMSDEYISDIDSMLLTITSWNTTSRN